MNKGEMGLQTEPRTRADASDTSLTKLNLLSQYVGRYTLKCKSTATGQLSSTLITELNAVRSHRHNTTFLSWTDRKGIAVFPGLVLRRAKYSIELADRMHKRHRNCMTILMPVIAT